MSRSIVCLFSVDNLHDQPNNNLICFWHDKPAMEAVAQALGVSFPASDDEDTLAVVKIWSGETVRLAETDYRLQTVEPGEKL